MRISRDADLSLTCKTLHVPHFVPLGFAEVRRRGDVTDLVVLEADRDLYAGRCAIAALGVPFYGCSLVSRDAVPVVFAAVAPSTSRPTPARPARRPQTTFSCPTPIRASSRLLSPSTAVSRVSSPLCPIPCHGRS
jgi:hypothetical protein